MEELIKCACRCGGVRPRFDSKGRERFYLNGHFNRKQRKRVPCACGCGTKIDAVDEFGHDKRFVHGHNGRGALHYDYKGGKYINDQGYVMVLRPDHPRAASNGYVREHILVMEAFLGRPLKLPEVIHHINHNRQDNRIENLQLFESTSIHMATAHKHRTKRNVTIDNQGQITPNFLDTSNKVIH